MAKEPVDLIIPMLREMRAETSQQFAEIRERLDKLESGQKTIRQALTADTMMTKFSPGISKSGFSNWSARSTRS